MRFDIARSAIHTDATEGIKARRSASALLRHSLRSRRSNESQRLPLNGKMIRASSSRPLRALMARSVLDCAGAPALCKAWMLPNALQSGAAAHAVQNLAENHIVPCQRIV